MLATATFRIEQNHFQHPENSHVSINQEQDCVSNLYNYDKQIQIDKNVSNI